MAGKVLCPPLLLCSRCKDCAYCDKECQKRSWRAGHKKKCGQAAVETVASRAATAQAKKTLHDALLARTKKPTHAARKVHEKANSSGDSFEASGEYEREGDESEEDEPRSMSREDLIESKDSPLTAKQKRVLSSLYSYAALVQQPGLGAGCKAREARGLAEKEGEFCELAAAMEDCDNLHIAAMIYEELGKIEEKLRDYVKAVEFFEKGKRMREKATPPDRHFLIGACYFLGN